MTSQRNMDFLVIGGGVLGINLALALKRRFTDCSVTLIEKERHFGEHASGRNSGVLHAGFYYTADSLKARFTVEGNRRLTEYCEANDLLINRCGKLVIAQDEHELSTLNELLKRGRHNGVILEEIDEKQAREIEPRVKTHEKALFSPTTSSVDPRQVMARFVEDARAAGVKLLTGTAYVRRAKDGIVSNRGKMSAAYVVNAAGLYADKIARDYGFCKDYCILPFKGLYLISKEQQNTIKTNIYPVPDLNNPFLGVHFTVTAHGKVKIGPTAIPAFWREHYRGLGNFNFSEMFDITGRELGLLLHNDFGFRRLALQELAKYSKSHMVKLAAKMASGVNKSDYYRGPAGIRAQLFDTKRRMLEMDFRFEGDSRSFHVLNAVSPAFTCCLSFTDYLLENILTHISA